MVNDVSTATRSELWVGVGALALCALLGGTGCGSDENAVPSSSSDGGSSSAGANDTSTANEAYAGNPASGSEAGAAGSASLCPPAQSSYSIPARAALYEPSTSNSNPVMLVSELVGRVDGFCAGCHRAPAAQGNFSYTTDDFETAIPSEAVALIQSKDDMTRMPPSSPYPIRDDLLELASLLQLWLDQGRPTVTIKLPAAVTNASVNPFAVSKETGPRLTNLGDCIPAAKIVGADWDADDDAREEMFANIRNFEQLPKKLSQTDLFTLDTETLARHRTVAIAPTYQLWSFDASKLRLLHLPKGTSLRYDASLNTFVAPQNTRVYKTFFKPVTDENGKIGYRKMETRLIIARPDIDSADEMQSEAVFGTYVWNADESEATLLEKPYIGTDLTDPNLNTYTFKDLIEPYVTDEREFQDTLEAVDNHSGSVISRPLQGTKEYPVPGWHRCLQCHEGSPTKNFLLGLTPTQLNRRPLGAGGVYEAPGPDELTQAQRLIDYGLITGIHDPSDFIKLEDSAGGRKSRNVYELRAQGYAVGNCAGCHNPRGYPTRLNPSLQFYNLLPGGIVFQFPLEQRSPLRIRDGETNGWQYVNPALSQRPVDMQAQLLRDGNVTDAQRTEVGPWDSLIFRNVQTPRTYGEGSIIFPHMPLHVAGIDCRAETILGSWITSIPYTSAVDQSNTTITVDSDSAEARASAEARVQAFLAQEPACEPAQDLRDWGAVAPNFTDLVPPIGIPDRPHWFEEDFTEVFGDFQPRGGQWHAALLLDNYAYIRNFEPSAELLQFVQREVPFDFWQDKPDCDFSKVPDFPAPAPYWMDQGLRPDGDPKRVYSTLPGAAVFGAICSNCHGPRATAESNLASTIANLTGGTVRVANWAQGLFGPLSSPDSNLSYFTTQTLDDKSSLGEYGAAKYMLFMALGGTQALIPPAAMRQVAAARVASQTRMGDTSTFSSTANMLEIAKEVCANTIQYSLDGGAVLSTPYDPVLGELTPNPTISYGQVSPRPLVVTQNGEYLLYKQLCAISNPTPVRMIEYDAPGTASVVAYFSRNEVIEAGLTWNGDSDPWCVSPDSLYKPPGAALCPSGNSPNSDAVAQSWISRGVLNVGFSVYAYAKLAFAKPTEWRPAYDQCELRYPRN